MNKIANEGVILQIDIVDSSKVTNKMRANKL